MAQGENSDLSLRHDFLELGKSSRLVGRLRCGPWLAHGLNVGHTVWS
jgi:hypothetical protein